MGNIQIIAWWGAIVATLVLLWDIIKWLQSGPKIKKRIALNVHYNDGKIISTEKTENGTVTVFEEYCHVELVNVGNMPTTVMGISVTHKKTKTGSQSSIMQEAFVEHFGKKLPHVISPGEVWSCRVGMSHYHSISQFGFYVPNNNI